MALTSSYLGHLPIFPFPSVTSSVNTISKLPHETYARVRIIDDMVALNYGSLFHFNQLKQAQQLVDTIDVITKEAPSPTDDSTAPLTDTEEDEYFDGYTDIPVVDIQFFDR